MSEQGNKARKALHDMRWGPHIDDPVERQGIMDDTIKIALGTVAALEARLSKMESDIRPIIEADYTGQGSAQDYDAVLEMIQEELGEALAGER